MINWIIERYVISYDNLSYISRVVSDYLDEAEALPQMLTTVGIALLTILIPFAIAILSHFLRWESETKEMAFLSLDLSVILDRFFVIERLLLSNFMIFLPPILWDVFPDGRLWIILIWTMGVVWLTRMIYKVYEWRTTHDTNLRFDYLEELTDINRMKVVWPSVWIAARLDDRNERRYLSIFAGHISKLLEDKNYSDTIFLINHFRETLTQRLDLSLFAGENSFYRNLLIWHHDLYEQKRLLEAKEDAVDIEDQYILEHITTLLESLLTQVMELLIKHRHLFWFYSVLEIHKTDHEGDDTYLKDIFTLLLPGYFDKVISIGESTYLWEGFPESWTVKKLEKGESLQSVAAIIHEVYTGWLISKIQSQTVASGKGLEHLTERVYPGIDVGVFFRVLMLLHAPYQGNTVRAIIEKNWEYGFGNRGEDDKEKIKYTYDLVMSLENVSKFISKGFIDQLQKEYTGVVRKRWSSREKRRLQLLGQTIKELAKRHNDLYL